ncbi:MAG: PilZ domain-containing protein [Pseudomonadota bacterium]
MSKFQNKDGLAWQLVEKLDEQRRYPRIPINTKISLSTDDGSKTEAILINVSPDGFQLRCDVEAARSIHPTGGKLGPNPPFVNAAVVLPLGDEGGRMIVRGQLMYITTVDDEPRFIVGVRFAKMDVSSERVLNRFISDQLCDESGAAA